MTHLPTCEPHCTEFPYCRHRAAARARAAETLAEALYSPRKAARIRAENEYEERLIADLTDELPTAATGSGET